MAECIAHNPHFIVNGFMCAGISRVLDSLDCAEDDVRGELEDEDDFEDELEND